ncbi:MAG: hypothetical protein ABSA46_15215 [Thermodesulfovibrionales bacterium]
MIIARVVMTSMEQLKNESLAFEHRHNSSYRHSKIKGKTPLKALVATDTKLISPGEKDIPKHAVIVVWTFSEKYFAFHRRLNTNTSSQQSMSKNKSSNSSEFLSRLINTNIALIAETNHGIVKSNSFRVSSARCRDPYFCARCPGL